MHGWMTTLVPVCLGGCVLQTIELGPRSGNPNNDADICPTDYRVNPATQQCEPCLRRSPAASLVCACMYVEHASPFPYCEGDDANYDCQPCVGDVTACAAYDPDDGSISDCGRLQRCCRDLASAPSSTPCCPPGEVVQCHLDSGTGRETFECVTTTCCVGTACPGGAGDCAVWQSCGSGAQICTPACAPDTFCSPESGCSCVLIPP